MRRQLKVCGLDRVERGGRDRDRERFLLLKVDRLRPESFRHEMVIVVKVFLVGDVIVAVVVIVPVNIVVIVIAGQGVLEVVPLERRIFLIVHRSEPVEPLEVFGGRVGRVVHGREVVSEAE